MASISCPCFTSWTTQVVVIAFFDHEAGAWLERGIAGHPFDRRLPFPSGYRCSDCEATFPGVPDTSPAQNPNQTNTIVNSLNLP